MIDKALELPGFEEDVDNGAVTVGFARNAVLGVADKAMPLIPLDWKQNIPNVIQNGQLIGENHPTPSGN